ncbi:helix-turn-helix domain-containing protein [Conexibacter sp. SYSU D00693]|uniref:helix-turn-helix domain-containing protein n=1 Tax=Conexibacter sp. SYSU D00693 TaxID=2812560 RepID=UPI00196A4932|nr:helix-turn-helix domain-containing protein [Conexibacter sp. SYSU D00693]
MDEWVEVVELVERVVADEELLPTVVAGVQRAVAEVAVLPPSDMAGHTRALLTAAVRAVGDRRLPTEAELSFVAGLGTTRARQGIPIEAVLAAIHVAERAIWTRARELAPRAGVSPERLLDARELYDDWSDAVRTRLIRAHREARSAQRAPAEDRRAALLRRLLEGGTAAALAAAEAGLPLDGGLWVLVARTGDAASSRALRAAVRHHPTAVAAEVGEVEVAVTARQPAEGGAGVVGLAGPVAAEDLAAAHRLAVAAVPAAEASGRAGLVHVGRVATVAAVLARADLAATLADRHGPAVAALGDEVARTVRVWLERRRETAAAARELAVHPNTVRNRVLRFAEVTGLELADPFDALDAWWLCRYQEPGEIR